MNMTVKPNFKVCGAIFGKEMRDYQLLLETLSTEEVSKLNNGDTITKEFKDREIQITKDMVEIRISNKEGFDVGMEGNEFVILNTELTDNLISEGIARELISKIQNLRKSLDFNITDRINVYYNCDDEVKRAINNFSEIISKEVLALSLKEANIEAEALDINGHEVLINIEVA